MGPIRIRTVVISAHGLIGTRSKAVHREGKDGLLVFDLPKSVVVVKVFKGGSYFIHRG